MSEGRVLWSQRLGRQFGSLCGYRSHLAPNYAELKQANLLLKRCHQLLSIAKTTGMNASLAAQGAEARYSKKWVLFCAGCALLLSCCGPDWDSLLKNRGSDGGGDSGPLLGEQAELFEAGEADASVGDAGADAGAIARAR